MEKQRLEVRRGKGKKKKGIAATLDLVLHFVLFDLFHIYFFILA